MYIVPCPLSVASHPTFTSPHLSLSLPECGTSCTHQHAVQLAGGPRYVLHPKELQGAGENLSPDEVALFPPTRPSDPSPAIQAPTSDINLPVSLMNLMWSLMDEFREDKPQVGVDEVHCPHIFCQGRSGRTRAVALIPCAPRIYRLFIVLPSSRVFVPLLPQVVPKDVPKLLDSMFIFALIWSIGGSTESEGRAKFSEFLRKLTNGVSEGGIGWERGRPHQWGN